MRRTAGLGILIVSALALGTSELKSAEDLSKVPLVDMSTVIFAPRPRYPYQARYERQTGRGIVLLDIDAANGRVIKARMAKSTRNRVLDEAALAAFRAWRFRKGVPARQKAPITFTMTGMRY